MRPPLVFEPRDEVVGLRPTCGFQQLLLGRVRAAEHDVVANGAVQKRGILRHHADMGAQRLLCHMRNILPIDQDAPLLHVIEAQKQIDERRLAGA